MRLYHQQIGCFGEFHGFYREVVDMYVSFAGSSSFYGGLLKLLKYK